MTFDHAALVAPREQLGVLVSPPAPQAVDAANAFREGLRAGVDARLLNESIPHWRADLIAELGLPSDQPVYMTGHQAEFVHAGVLAKSIALDALGRNATVVYLVADSDTPKDMALTIIEQSEGEQPRRHSVSMPGVDLEQPAETQPAGSADAWSAFFDDICAVLPDCSSRLVAETRAAWLDGAVEINWTEACIRLQCMAETALRLASQPVVRVSALSRTRAFAAFAGQLLRDADAFAEHYNRAQRRYRERFGVRSEQRPVPLLAVDGERVEAPFWLYEASGPRRRAFVSPATESGGVTLFADETPIATLPIDDAALLSGVHSLEALGWRLRPRALSLTAFCRLLLCDLFVHGIGGAKYDAMTDDFVARYFGIEPSPVLCVTATLYPPVERYPDATPAALTQAQRALRDLRFNPQRAARGLPPALLDRRAALIAESERLRDEAQRVTSANRRAVKRERRATFLAIHAANAELCGVLETELETRQARVGRLKQQLHHNRLAEYRELFFGFHRRDALAQLAGRIRDVVKGPSR